MSQTIRMSVPKNEVQTITPTRSLLRTIKVLKTVNGIVKQIDTKRCLSDHVDTWKRKNPHRNPNPTRVESNDRPKRVILFGD